jgi:mannose-6-phosphate isomerase
MQQNRLYPLKFKPIFKDKIWGGNRISKVLGMDISPLTTCGEAWVLSGHHNGPSVVANGFLAGNELNELIEVYMDDLVGAISFDRFGDEFPLLIKFIDSNDYLSIQVHPDDELAADRYQTNGKSEMWYVISSEDGAGLFCGFKGKVDRELFIKHLTDKTLPLILNNEKVKEGDVFYVPAGRIHSLGPGILLTEIQQTSDITYRIYDWDRVDSHGSPRELHTLQALDAIHFEDPEPVRLSYRNEQNNPVTLLNSPHFTTNLIDLTQPVNRDYSELDSFVIYICTGGKARLEYRDGHLPVNTGDTFLIPAELTGCRLVPSLRSRILEVYLEE